MLGLDSRRELGIVAASEVNGVLDNTVAIFVNNSDAERAFFADPVMILATGIPSNELPKNMPALSIP